MSGEHACRGDRDGRCAQSTTGGDPHSDAQSITPIRVGATMRADMQRRALVLLVTTIIAAVSIAPSARAEPNRRVLSMRAADRAIDLAWRAELAGDYSGARTALTQLVESS